MLYVLQVLGTVMMTGSFVGCVILGCYLVWSLDEAYETIERLKEENRLLKASKRAQEICEELRM